jgi:hypothetical protein
VAGRTTARDAGCSTSRAACATCATNSSSATSRWPSGRRAVLPPQPAEPSREDGLQPNRRRRADRGRRQVLRTLHEDVPRGVHRSDEGQPHRRQLADVHPLLPGGAEDAVPGAQADADAAEGRFPVDYQKLHHLLNDERKSRGEADGFSDMLHILAASQSRRRTRWSPTATRRAHEPHRQVRGSRLFAPDVQSSKRQIRRAVGDAIKRCRWSTRSSSGCEASSSRNRWPARGPASVTYEDLQRPVLHRALSVHGLQTEKRASGLVQPANLEGLVGLRVLMDGPARREEGRHGSTCPS